MICRGKGIAVALHDHAPPARVSYHVDLPARTVDVSPLSVVSANSNIGLTLSPDHQESDPLVKSIGSNEKVNSS